MIYLGGVTQKAIHQDVQQTHGAAPTHTSQNAGQETTNTNVGVDPLENVDLASKPEHTEIRRGLEKSLHAIVDPNLTDARAKANQHKRRI